jgi:hypothetical protein
MRLLDPTRSKIILLNSEIKPPGWRTLATPRTWSACSGSPFVDAQAKFADHLPQWSDDPKYLCDYALSPAPRTGRSPACIEKPIVVLDDWPEVVPITDAELRVWAANSKAPSLTLLTAAYFIDIGSRRGGRFPLWTVAAFAFEPRNCTTLADIDSPSFLLTPSWKKGGFCPDATDG